jgi:hypothetical protein
MTDKTWSVHCYQPAGTGAPIGWLTYDDKWATTSNAAALFTEEEAKHRERVWNEDGRFRAAQRKACAAERFI